MLKIIGSALIIASFTLGGFFIARKYSERPKQLRIFQQGLQMLETEIVYGAIPLYMAMENVGSRLSGPIKKFFLSMSKYLQELDGASAYECWKKSIIKHFPYTSLKSQDKEIILQFGQTLGISDREDQMKHIRLAVQHLATEEHLARDEQKNYEKLSKNLGLLLGILIVILMY